MKVQQFGARLRQLRKQLGLTQRGLADKVGVDFSYLSKIESGAAPPPSDKVVLRLAEVLHADEEELLTLAGRIPPDIAEALKNREAWQLLRSKRTRSTIRTWHKISGSIKTGSQNIINLGGILKSSLSLARVAMAVVLVVAVATSLWFVSPVRALNIDITNPSSGTLGSTYSFSVNVTIADAELLPIQRIDLKVYKSGDSSYEATYRSLPLDSGSQAYSDSEEGGGGALSVTATAASTWAYNYGHGYAVWQSTAYRFFSPGGYGYGYGGGATSIAYAVRWTSPSNWPASSNYRIDVILIADGTTFTSSSDTFSLRALAAGGAGAAPPTPVPTPGVTDISDFVDRQGKFTRSAIAQSEDGKVELDIEKGTTGKTAAGAPLTKVSMTPMTTPPTPPAGASIVGMAYDISPDGATFDPAITITFTYDPDDIPEGVNEEDLVLAYWDSSEWVVLKGSVVDPAENTITAPVSHFTPFAVIAYSAPAAFTVSDLTISPAEVGVGESITISITVTNTGDLTGEYELILKIDGVVIASKKVALAGDASQEITFTASKDTAGTYTVGLGGLSGTFTVKAPPVPPVPPPPAAKPTPAPPAPAPVPPVPAAALNWWLIGGIIAGVAVVGLVIWIVIRRREMF